MITIKHDGKLDIAKGKSRNEKNWKNTQVAWSDLLTRVSKTHYTAETHAEYMAATRTRQDEIKDVGGFVGGYLTGGRRKPANVAHRQLITLDLDHATPESWDSFCMLYDCAAAVYSTHKHTPESPRLRLLIPLDREVFADEYVAIGRRIAGDIGIEHFDNTGFQPSRLMYWPSTSKGAEYVFEYQDRPWLSADSVLARYHDWRDSSEWPVSEKVSRIIQNGIKKQGDPLEKPGVVGAFCRTYNIHEVIETYLADVYEPCDVEDRYTYKEGSTAAGLITYDDKYAYSHHGTDPTSGKLCNAFDLVRLHKYGLKDEDAREGTPINKMPSYQEMLSFATRDAKVRRQLGEEKLKEAFADFDDEVPAEYEGEAQDSDNAWLEKMEVDKKGTYLSTINNAYLVLTNDKLLKGRLALNMFENREVALGHLPWRKITPATRYMVNADDASLRRYMETHYGITSAVKIKDALDIVFRDNGFHPVREYIESLTWDGTGRVEDLLIDYLGAEDSLYTRTVTRKALVAAVARIFNPGCKYDTMPILIGPQGIGKSTLIDKLGGQWFSDSFSFSMLGTNQAIEQLQGAWLIEVGELTGLSNADIEAAKSFMSKREDRYRVAYGKRVEFFPRQSSFWGTTNKLRPLRDSSGNRRFWPVVCGAYNQLKSVFIDLTPAEVGQVWAEAYQIYKGGEPLHLSGEVSEIAEKIQASHTDVDDRIGMIQDYLDTKLPENWDEMDIYKRREFLRGDDMSPVGTVIRKRVCAAEVWCEVLGGTIKDMTTQNTKFVHNVLQHLPGWKPSKSTWVFSLYGYQRGYQRSKILTNTDLI